MGRMTRKKAADLAESLHVDEDALLEQSIIDAKTNALTPVDRKPLGELEVNSADSKSQSDDASQELRKSTRGRKGGKKAAGKGKKNNANDLGASTASQAENIDDAQEVLPDDNDSIPSPASEKAAEDLMKDVPEFDSLVQDSKSKQAPSAAVKLTRSQLGKQRELELEPKSLVDGLGQTREEQEDMKEESLTAIENPTIKTTAPTEENELFHSVMQGPLDAPASPLPSAVPNVIASLRVETPAKRSTSNKENVEPADMDSPQTNTYDTLEYAAVAAATPPGPSRSNTSRLEDPIEALDELDDAVEVVNKDIPDVQSSPEKPKVKREPKKAAPVVRTTKAAQARISMAHNPDAAARPPALGRPSPAKGLARAGSVRQTSGSKASPTSSRVVSTTSTKDGSEPGEKKEVVIPHSKPRPVSLSFPTPPPPPKSSKAPTQSTFQLPGEAVSAKFKAAREERMRKEAEDKEKKAFKARPIPAALSKAPSVRQTNASRARESVMNGKDPKAGAPLAGHKRTNTVATTNPAAPKPRITSREAPKFSSSTGPARSELSVKKRPSTALASTSKPARTSTTSTVRPSTSFAASTTTSQRPPSNGAKGTVKGKEVFNRAATAKAAADKEKTEREAAIKKARAEAAERSKQASREWAEKQRLKKLGIKPETKPAPAEQAPTQQGVDTIVEEGPAEEAPIESVGEDASIAV